MIQVYYIYLMSSIFLEIGQCGCQIGVPLNQKLSPYYYCTRFRPPNRVHAIMVDTEPKVIKQITTRQPKWLDPANVKYFEYGRGNNWSYGYLHHLPKKLFHTDKFEGVKQFSHIQPATLDKYLEENRAIAEYVIERIRRELQNTDCAVAVNVLGSLGGGTGSGLGTKIVECIRQEFRIQTYSHLILPNKSGESPLQVYNCLLSLASHQEHSSAIFTYENDKMMSLFNKLEQKQTSLDDINNHLASNIARLVEVNQLPNYGRFYSHLISQCVLSPELKFLNLFSAESKKGKWDEALPQLIEQIKNYQSDGYGEEFITKDRREKLLQGELLLVGPSQIQFEERYSKKLRQVLNPESWDCLNEERLVVKGREGVEGVLLANHSSITHYLEYLVSSGSKKYEAGAYLWHYQYADIQQAINTVNNIVQQYQYTTHS